MCRNGRLRWVWAVAAFRTSSVPCYPWSFPRQMVITAGKVICLTPLLALLLKYHIIAFLLYCVMSERYGYMLFYTYNVDSRAYTTVSKCWLMLCSLQFLKHAGAHWHRTQIQTGWRRSSFACCYCILCCTLIEKNATFGQDAFAATRQSRCQNKHTCTATIYF